MLNILLQAAPVPRDIPLPLPLPEWLLVILLVVSFLAHILFVNLMVGGSLVTLWAEIKGLRDAEYDTLAHEVAATITVNKSLAVVLGVAPLLSINALYPIFFYSANALTGLMWIAIIPLVSIAFLLTYLHKYSWHAMRNNKLLHIGIIALANLLFLFIPFIFLTNINLMLFPERWEAVKGFISALLLPNVFPRYFHFLCASLAITGLFLFWYLGRERYPFEERFKHLDRYILKRKAYSLTLGASFAQMLIGPIVLITLPVKGIGANMLLMIATGVAMALPAMWWMWKAISGPKEHIDRHFSRIALLMTLVVACMGYGRHLYRANALAPHRALMATRTAEFERLSREAREQEALVAAERSNEPVDGAELFSRMCGACHKPDEKLVGPPITEMVGIYSNDPAALKAWIKAPGKKRPDYPQMPGFPQLSKAELDAIAAYLLTSKETGK